MPAVVRFDDFELDPVRGQLRRAGRRVRIQPQPLTILVTLVARAGQTVSRAELQAALWPDGRHVEYDTALNTAVRKLRRVLGDSASDPVLIQTVPGIGYRFIGEVRVDSQSQPSVAMRQLSDSGHLDTSRRTAVHPASLAALAVLLSIAILTTPVAPGPEGAARLVAAGVTLLMRHPDAASAARTQFEAAIARDPESAAAWGWLALTYARMASDRDTADASAFGLARGAAERALALKDNLWTAHAALGLVLSSHDGQPSGATSEFAKAVAAGAFDPRVFTDYACVLKSMGRPELALAVIENGLRRVPRSAVLHAHRGLYLHAVHRYDEELPAILEGLALDPQSAEAHFHLGLAYARRRQYAASLASLQIAVSLSPGAPHIRWWLGQIASEAARHS